MTLRELAIKLNGCIDPDRGNGPEWDFIKAEGMLMAYTEDVVMTMMGAERIAVEAAKRECADRAKAFLAEGEDGEAIDLIVLCSVIMGDKA